MAFTPFVRITKVYGGGPVSGHWQEWQLAVMREPQVPGSARYRTIDYLPKDWTFPQTGNVFLAARTKRELDAIVAEQFGVKTKKRERGNEFASYYAEI